MFALVDGNNFYVSCERVFRPGLLGRPVIVLSNNDGCAIARSNEAKALGITMGAPWFQIRQMLPDAGVIALSANFTLYGDMSSRMAAIAAGLIHLGQFTLAFLGRRAPRPLAPIRNGLIAACLALAAFGLYVAFVLHRLPGMHDGG